MAAAEKALKTSDRALLRAYRAWGAAEFTRSIERFSPDWGDRLRSGWPSSSRLAADLSWAELRREHVASSRPDPSRIHPSWFLRALKSESLAIQLTVVANSPPAIREYLRRGLGLDLQIILPEHRPDPDVLAWVISLWSERIVGDIAIRDDDPPVIIAITQFSGLELARLVKVCGVAKHAFAMTGRLPSKQDEAIAHFSQIDRLRIGYFRRHIGVTDPRLGPLARMDLEVIGNERRRGHSRLGLMTFGRLLDVAEPHRARWAMQHLPYQVVRGMRVKSAVTTPRRALAGWESWVLEAAWARLLNEGRLSKVGRQSMPELEVGASR